MGSGFSVFSSSRRSMGVGLAFCRALAGNAVPMEFSKLVTVSECYGQVWMDAVSDAIGGSRNPGKRSSKSFQAGCMAFLLRRRS